MAVSLESCRRSLLVGAALLAAVALAIAFGVVPPVRSDAFPRATPARAAAAFRVNVALDVLAAAVLLLVATRSTSRTRLSTTALASTAFVVILLGVALLDAASAMSGHGPAMRAPTTILFACAAADLAVGVLVVATTLRFPACGPEETRGGDTAAGNGGTNA